MLPLFLAGLPEPKHRRGLLGVGTRLTAADLSVYGSDTNDGDWRLIDGVQVDRIESGFHFTGLRETARFVKVVQPYADDAFTFTHQVSKMLEVVTEES